MIMQSQFRQRPEQYVQSKDICHPKTIKNALSFYQKNFFGSGGNAIRYYSSKIGDDFFALKQFHFQLFSQGLMM